MAVLEVGVDVGLPVELIEDEVFVSYEAARTGVIFDNTGSEPLVTLRYFGPDTNPDAPAVGAYKNSAQ